MKTLSQWVFLSPLYLWGANLSANDLDGDYLTDVIESDVAAFAAGDLILETADLDLTTAQLTGRGGQLASETVQGLTAVSFHDDTSGFGYFRLSKWTGDLSSAYGQTFHFGILTKALDLEWATTTTRDLAFVSNSGIEVNIDLRHGVMQHQLSPSAFGEVCQYSISIEPESFDTSEDKLLRVLSDLSHIEIRSEFWKGISGVECYLIAAGTYLNVTPDTDGDGTPDLEDLDSDNDGIPDRIEGAEDSDRDGLANYRDLDSDDDGLLDAIEGTANRDGDALPNYLDPDSDNDGLSDEREGLDDADEDGLANYQDNDSDNDGLRDSVEGITDNDGDGLANYLDSDSDEDGIPDGVDKDADGDGIPNNREAFALGGQGELVINGDFSSGKDAFSTSYSQTLSELDDGVAQPEGAFEIAEDPSDVTANFASFGDYSGGGKMLVIWTGPTTGERVWSQETTVEPGMTYVFSAAVASALTNREPALDFRVNGVSLGVPVVGGELGEWSRTYATFVNGEDTQVTLSIHSVKTTVQQTAFGLDEISFIPFTTDSDGDGVANFLDLDSDNDTLADSFEGASDFDGDGLPNYLDLDSDNDTIPDRLDGGNDFDNDGQSGFIDLDSDNDQIEDYREGSGDFDGDGIPDHEDSDSDNDGTPDAPGEDADGDGLWNEEESLTLDSDDDGTPNYLDPDSDNDGLLDSVEGFLDTDADGTPDYIDHQPAFPCSGYALESYNANTQLALVDVTQGVFINLGNTDHGLNYNAIGYNPADDYIYGLNRTQNTPELLRIGSDGSVAKVGLIDGLPRSYVAGTFAADGLYWVSGGGRIYGIDVEALAVVRSHAHSPNPSGAEIDLAYNPVDGNMYGSTSRGAFFKVDLTNGNTTIIGNNGKTFGALICDFNGTVYGFDNKGTGAFRVNLSNGQVTWVANAPKTGINDGTICPKAILVVDSDGDGIDDEADTDDDNDGTPDEFEGGTCNPNGDEDGDGIRNWTDTIDNGDEGDRSITDYTDRNGDGIPDVFDVDGDSTPNHLDQDSDGDGLTDDVELTGDADEDGLANFLDNDADNDGLLDGVDGLGDTDGDLIANYLDNFDDRDQDNDGIKNGDEGTDDFDGDGIPNHLDTDTDSDGVADADEILDNGTILDSDGDGIPNFLDIDDDGDGIPTLEDDCALCNLDDNIIEFELSEAQIRNYGVDPLYYQYAREIWNEVKYELNCNTDGIPLEEEKRGFDEERFFLEADSEVFVTVIYDGAKNVNSVAWYNAADPNGSWTVFWEKYGTGPTAPLIPGSTASLGILPAETELRFGLVADGGRGGITKIHQDSYLNPGGLELIASQINISNNPLIVSFEDQIFAGRDNDFNDVIFMVEIVPTAPATLQFGDSGLASSAVSEVLTDIGWNHSDYEISADFFKLPTAGPITIELLGDRSKLDFTLALVDYDIMAQVDPRTLQFRAIAGENAVTLLDNRTVVEGSQVTFNPQSLGLAGKQVLLAILPHNRFDRFTNNPHRYTPHGNGDETRRQPLFSMTNANPSTQDQYLTFSDGDSTLVMVEDISRSEVGPNESASDSDFADLWIQFTPALEAYSIGGGGYYQGSLDPTTEWDGVDGYSGEQNGDF